jgi:F0F1-type ATP synthase assembly protein I
MSPDPRRNDAWSDVGIGWTITATLLGGILAWGALGYLADRLLGTQRVLTAVGMVVGAAGAIYLVYLKYGRGEGGGET